MVFNIWKGNAFKHWTEESDSKLFWELGKQKYIEICPKCKMKFRCKSSQRTKSMSIINHNLLYTHTQMEQVLLPWALQCSPVSFLFLSTLWWLLIQDTINKSKYSLFSILVSNIHYGIYQRQAEKNGTHWQIWPFLKNKWKKMSALHNFFFFKLNNFFGATFRSDADKGGYLKWD